jgi:hypothetical protein
MRRRRDQEEIGRMKLSKKISVGALLAGAMLAGSIAYAAWTATGSGSGYARATSAQPLDTVDVAATTSATLYPGATGNAKIQIHNPNPYPVRVTGVSWTGATIDSNSTAACDASTGVAFIDQSGLTLDVPAGGSVAFPLNGAVTMNNTSHTDCQGAVFTIPVTLTGVSNAP